MEQTIIAHTPTQFINLSYQVGTSHTNKKTWLNKVNILLDDMIIEKIKFNNTEYNQQIAEKVAFDFIKKKMTVKKYTSKKQKVNKTAKRKAASNLMNDLNI